jgi:hypothetical protein
VRKNVIIGEVAGLYWLIADAAWAIGDRLNWKNTIFVGVMFAAAIIHGIWFICLQWRGDKKDWGLTSKPPGRGGIDSGSV